MHKSPFRCKIQNRVSIRNRNGEGNIIKVNDEYKSSYKRNCGLLTLEDPFMHLDSGQYANVTVRTHKTPYARFQQICQSTLRQIRLDGKVMFIE